MTRLHPGTVDTLSLAVGVASLTIGLVSLLTTLHVAVPHLAGQARPAEAAEVLVSRDYREHPGHGVRIRFFTPPTVAGKAASCIGGCPAPHSAATIRD